MKDRTKRSESSHFENKQMDFDLSRPYSPHCNIVVIHTVKEKSFNVYNKDLNLNRSVTFTNSSGINQAAVFWLIVLKSSFGSMGKYGELIA